MDANDTSDLLQTVIANQSGYQNLKDGGWHMITLSTDDAGGRAVYLFIDGQLQGQVPLTGEYKRRLRTCKFVCYFSLPKLQLQYSKYRSNGPSLSVFFPQAGIYLRGISYICMRQRQQDKLRIENMAELSDKSLS